MPKKWVWIVVLLIFYDEIYSAPNGKKFGDVTISDLSTLKCPIDSNAKAYYIFDFGSAHFENRTQTINSTDVARDIKGFRMYFNRHFQIKILNKEAFDWSEISIPIYRDQFDDQIIKLKASTYNLEDGKITETKLDKKDISEKRLGQFWFARIFSMPDVKEGSIIEVEYTIETDYYFELREWYFQHSIPVLESRYQVDIPEFFVYSKNIKGYLPVNTQLEQVRKELRFKYKQEAEGIAVTEATYNYNYKYWEDQFEFSIEKVPAFQEEPFLLSKENYISKIEFEIQSTNFPNTIPKYYTEDWKSVCENLLNNVDFGLKLQSRSHLKKEVRKLETQDYGDHELINLALNNLKNKMVWNGVKDIYAYSSLDVSYEAGIGNSADINLNLVALLLEFGFDAFPLVLSTQDHGYISRTNASIRDFNYVIAAIRQGESLLLLDATDPYSQLNLLPSRCINDKGRTIEKDGGTWIDFDEFAKFNIMHSNKISLDTTSNSNIQVSKKFKNYAAYQILSDYGNLLIQKDTSGFINGPNKYVGIDNIQINGNPFEQREFELNFNYTENILQKLSKNTYSINPSLDYYISENPFKSVDRTYPVEFNYKTDILQTNMISLPEYLEVVKLPEPLILKSANGKLKYSYDIRMVGSNISLNIILNIDKSIFMPEDYPDLKKFFDIILAKQNESITLSSGKQQKD